MAEALKLADAQLVLNKSFTPFVFMLDGDGAIHRGEVPGEIQGTLPPDPVLAVKLTVDLFSGHAENLLAMVAVLDPQVDGAGLGLPKGRMPSLVRVIEARV